MEGLILHNEWDIRNPICDCCTARSHKSMEGHTAQWDIRNPICDSYTATSLKPIVIIHTAQLDIRIPICDSYTTRSLKPMDGLILHNVTSEIRSVILTLQRHSSLWRVSHCTKGHQKSDLWLLRCKVTQSYGGSHTAQLDIRNPICDSCTARSHKPIQRQLHNGTSEIRSVILALQGHTSLSRVKLHNVTSEIRSVILALQGHICQWRVILHNGTSEIRSVILALQGHACLSRVKLHNVTSEIRSVILALQGQTSLWRFVHTAQ